MYVFLQTTHRLTPLPIATSVAIETLHHLQINAISKPEADVRVVEMAAFDIALDEGHGGKHGKTGPS